MCIDFLTSSNQKISISTLSCYVFLYWKVRDGFEYEIVLEDFNNAYHIPLELQNVAVGKPATQSSPYERGSADHAVDGNGDGNYDHESCTHTGNSHSGDNNPWWRVDLQEVYRVHKVKFT